MLNILKTLHIFLVITPNFNSVLIYRRQWKLKPYFKTLSIIKFVFNVDLIGGIYLFM